MIVSKTFEFSFPSFFGARSVVVQKPFRVDGDHLLDPCRGRREGSCPAEPPALNKSV